MVDEGSAGRFVELVWRMVLRDGVAKQLAAVRAGFDEVFGMEHLGVLRGDELEGRLRGDGGPWDAESVRAAVRADHGYREGSLPVLWLVNAIAEMGRSERRLLLRFLTGSPTLPSGGLARLQPPLTVVRKDAEPPLGPDDYLPSVMTCANYLKLPEYSSEAVLRERLHTAMREGQLSFLLS